MKKKTKPKDVFVVLWREELQPSGSVAGIVGTYLSGAVAFDVAGAFSEKNPDAYVSVVTSVLE